jgi:hypothetical protein
MKLFYRIEYWNDLWKDWLDFDQYFYKIEENAQKRVEEYKDHKTGIKLRIVKTEILPSKSKRKNKVSTEKV